MSQPDLFAVNKPLPAWCKPAARASDPATSRAAAADAARSASAGRRLALETLRAHPKGLTDFELAALTGWQQTSIGKRRGECVAAGLVEATADKRPAPSGSMATVWRLTGAGRLTAEVCL